MTLWETRESATQLLEDALADKEKVMSDTIYVIDECIDIFEEKSLEKNDPHYRICGLTFLKAKNMGLGIYSLTLDVLGQEAGALLRPFLEYSELLIYFRLFPSAVEKALEDDLPKAGDRAKAIGSKLKGFRSYLSEHASHSAYSYYSLNHLLEQPSFKFRKLQRMIPSVLEKNIGDLFIQLLGLAMAAVNLLESREPRCADKQTEDILRIRKEGFDLFGFNNVLV